MVIRFIYIIFFLIIFSIEKNSYCTYLRICINFMYFFLFLQQLFLAIYSNIWQIGLRTIGGFVGGKSGITFVRNVKHLVCNRRKALCDDDYGPSARTAMSTVITLDCKVSTARLQKAIDFSRAFPKITRLAIHVQITLITWHTCVKRSIRWKSLLLSSAFAWRQQSANYFIEMRFFLRFLIPYSWIINSISGLNLQICTPIFARDYYILIIREYFAHKTHIIFWMQLLWKSDR